MKYTIKRHGRGFKDVAKDKPFKNKINKFYASEMQVLSLFMTAYAIKKNKSISINE